MNAFHLRFVGHLRNMSNVMPWPLLCAHEHTWIGYAIFLLLILLVFVAAAVAATYEQYFQRVSSLNRKISDLRDRAQTWVQAQLQKLATRTRGYVHMNAYAYGACMHTYLQTPIHTHLHTRTYTYTYINTHIHI